MSPWDLYRQVLHHLHGGRLTMELDGELIRFEWFPHWPAAGSVGHAVTLREFQAFRWEAGQQIAEKLWWNWRLP